MDGIAPRILRNNTPADATSFAFNYRSTHDPNDLDGDPETTDLEHEYYAEFILRAVQNGATDEWTYLALIFEAHGIYLREWVDDDVTELASKTTEVEHAQDEWYQARVEMSGTGLNTVKVYQGVPGSTLDLAFEATTSLDPDGRMGFGMGAVAAWHFDDLATLVPGTGDDYGPQVLNYYDALGRIVKRVVQPEGSSPETVYYHYDGDRIIEERDGAGGLLAAYYYGLYIDEVLRMDRGGNAYYFHQDDLYSVVAVTDAAGALVERYDYGDFGLPEIYDPAGLSLDASAIGNPFLFTGRRWHPELQLYHYRTRFMDPRHGRFISRDTIGLYGDPANLGNPNAYVGNNPWTRVDPWGEGPIDWALTGKWNPSNEEWQAAKRGFDEGAEGGAIIVADTFTFGKIDDLHQKADTYQGPEYTASRSLAGGSRELLITAATMGIGNAAANGGRVAIAAQKGLLMYEAASGGYEFGTGVNSMIEGNYKQGALDMFGGGLRVAGSILNAHSFEETLGKLDDSKGVVCTRSNIETGKKYVGQAKSKARYIERQAEHARANPDAYYEFEILERAKPGVAHNVAEEDWIRRLGGPKTKSNPTGTLENKRWQMNDTRYRDAGGVVGRK